MKIFWSWQSDTSQKTGRHFVRQALERAAEELTDHPDLDAAERPEVDSDTANVPGSPAIAATILDKIARCAVFVADVTPVATTPGGKKVPNPNVMIELGYALALVKNERIVLVMNQREGGSLSALPFDLRHWRGPLTYSLSRDAKDETIAAQLSSFSAGLVERLASSLAYSIQQTNAESETQAPAPLLADETDPAVWKGARPTITASSSGKTFELPVVSGPKLYCRIIPSAPFNATRADMLSAFDNRYPVMPFGDYSELWNGANEAGVLAWSQYRDGTLLSATQWFNATGEIWGVWPHALFDAQGRLTFTADHNARALDNFLESHFASLERFSARKPWKVVVGAQGLSGTFLPGNYRGGWTGLANTVSDEHRSVRGTAEERRAIGFSFLRKIYDAYGAPNLTKEGYDGFLPSNR